MPDAWSIPLHPSESRVIRCHPAALRGSDGARAACVPTRARDACTQGVCRAIVQVDARNGSRSLERCGCGDWARAARIRGPENSSGWGVRGAVLGHFTEPRACEGRCACCAMRCGGKSREGQTRRSKKCWLGTGVAPRPRMNAASARADDHPRRSSCRRAGSARTAAGTAGSRDALRLAGEPFSLRA